MPPPHARKDVVADVHFGVHVDDPYRWMEQDSAEFEHWLAAQGEYARQRLDALTCRRSFADRIQALRRPEEAEAQHFIDRGYLAEAGLHVDWSVPSPDGRRVVCALSADGAENCTLRIIGTYSGRMFDEAIANVHFPAVSWLDDGNTFLYHRYLDAPVDAPSHARRWDSRSYLHRLGDDPARDVVVLARGLNPSVALEPADRPFIHRPPGSAFMVAVVSHESLRGDTITEALSSCTLYLAPVAALADTARCRWIRVAGPEDRIHSFALGPDQLYLVGFRDADRGQVVAVDLANPQSTSLLVPESQRVIEAVRVIGTELLIRDLDAGVSRMRRVAQCGGEVADVPLPMEGTLVQWSQSTDGPGLLLRMESWVHAPRTFRWDPATTGSPASIEDPDEPDGFAHMHSHQLRLPARDGTLVPLTVVHRRGLLLDARRPTLLTAYGAHGIPYRPEYIPGMLTWLERDFVWAIAHVRGGGEHGRAWHRAGRLLTKENTITDFIDCAEHLITSGYTAPTHLAAVGGSAGAIPVAGALVRRPDLFAAVVLHAPLANTLRAEFSENGPVNTPENGSVTDQDGLRSLLITDACHRVRPGAHYPPVLLTTSRNDPRVPSWQPAKLAAHLQAAGGEGEALLRVEQLGGHGYGVSADLSDALLTDELAFVFDAVS